MKLLKSFLLVGSLLASTGFAGDLATVNGQSITEEEYKAALKALGPNAQMVASNPDMRKRFLDHLIERHLLSAKGKTDKLSDSEDFKARLDQAKEMILAEMTLDNYVQANTTDKHLQDYFKANKKTFEKDEIKASHILLKEEAPAQKVLEEALKGGNFAELAKKHSTGPSAPNGGDLGWFGRGQMVPEFETAAFATKKNTIYPKLVKTQFGYHIIKVEDKKTGADVKFEDNKEDIKNRLTMELRKQLNEELKKSAQIKINDDSLTKLKI